MPRGDADDAPAARLPRLPRQQLTEPHHAAAEPVLHEVALALVGAVIVVGVIVVAIARLPDGKI